MLLDLPRLGLEAEIRDFTRTIRLTQFIEKTSPNTKGTALPIMGERLVNHLSRFCASDAHGNFGIIRGGSMRSFLLDTHTSDTELSGIFGNPDPYLLGKDELAKRVADKVFTQPKDIDILLIYNNLNSKAVKDDFLLKEIAGFFEDLSFTGYAANDSRMDFFHGAYRIELIKHQHQGQTLVKVNIKESGNPVVRFHFGLVPQEKGNDIRFFDTASDGDKYALGYLTKGPAEILLRYFSFDDISYFSAQQTHDFFNPLTRPLSPSSHEQLAQTLTSNLREINFRISLLTEMLRSGRLYEFILTVPDFEKYANLPFVRLFIRAGSREFIKPELLDTLSWILKNKNSIEESKLLFDSDYYYGVTVNPFLFFLFAFPKNLFLASPLRDLFSNPLRIIEFLEPLAQSFGMSVFKNNLFELSEGYLAYVKDNINNSGPYRLVRWLVEHNALPKDTPITLSTFFQSLDPLKLQSFQVS